MENLNQYENIFQDLEYLCNVIKTFETRKNRILKKKNPVLKIIEDYEEHKRQEMKLRDNIEKIKNTHFH